MEAKPAAWLHRKERVPRPGVLQAFLSIKRWERRRKAILQVFTLALEKGMGEGEAG